MKPKYLNRRISITLAMLMLASGCLCACNSKAEPTSQDDWYACSEKINITTPYYLIRDKNPSEGITSSGLIPVVSSDNSFDPEEISLNLISSTDYEIKMQSEISMDTDSFWNEAFPFVIGGKAYLELDSSYDEGIETVVYEFNEETEELTPADIGTDLIVIDEYIPNNVDVLVATDMSEVFGWDGYDTHLLVYKDDLDPIDIDLNTFANYEELYVNYIIAGEDENSFVVAYDSYDGDTASCARITVDYEGKTFNWEYLGGNKPICSASNVAEEYYFYDNTGIYSGTESCDMIFDYSMTDCSMTLMEYLHPISVDDGKIVMGGYVYTDDYESLEYRMYTFDKTTNPYEGRECITIGVEGYVPDYMNSVLESYNSSHDSSYARIAIINDIGVKPCLAHTNSGVEYFAEIKQYLSGEDAPDVMIFNSYERAMNESGILQNLNSHVDLSETLEGIVELNKNGDELYVVPVLWAAVGISNFENGFDPMMYYGGDITFYAEEVLFGNFQSLAGDEENPFHNENFYNFLSYVKSLNDASAYDEDISYDYEYIPGGAEYAFIMYSEDFAFWDINSISGMTPMEDSGASFMSLGSVCAISDKDSSYEFIQYMISEDVQTAISGFGLPINENAYQNSVSTELTEEQQNLYLSMPSDINNLYIIDSNVRVVFENVFEGYLDDTYEEEDIADFLESAL